MNRFASRRTRPAYAAGLAGLLCCALWFAPEIARALKAGDGAPEIGLASLDGKQITLASLRGKVVLVDFWASWCAPCKDEMPFLESMYKRLGKRGLVVVGVSVDAELDNAKRFANSLKVTFPIVHDGKHTVADRYKPPRMPTSVLIDRAGKVRYVHGGFRKEDARTIEQEVTKLLGESQS